MCYPPFARLGSLARLEALACLALFTRLGIPARLGILPGVVFLAACPSGEFTSAAGNRPPVASNGDVATFAGSVVSGELRGTDPDGDPLQFSIVALPSKGTVTLVDAWKGTFQYEAQAGVSGSDSFTFRASDGELSSNTGIVSVTIASSNGTIPSGYHSVSGAVTYEAVSPRCEGAFDCRLDYANSKKQPVRGAVIKVITADVEARSIALGTTDAHGLYQIVFPEGPSLVKVVAYAETQSPPVLVKDNTQGGTRHAMVTEAFEPAETTRQDLHAASGWSESAGAYVAERVAAPFAILDATYDAASAFIAAGIPSFPLLKINWSIKNRAEVGTYESGAVITSHWNGNELYILGDADNDTDEFDVHVIIHEWGHYFESKVGRSDSIGGRHGFGDLLDPRVAFGEGWGNALGSIVRYPDSSYVDTVGVAQATGFAFDLEANDGEEKSGWYSESSVQFILYDLFDADEDGGGFDTVALGLGPIVEVLTGAQRQTSALTTLFSFIHGLKQLRPDEADAIDALLAKHEISPVQDEYGASETNDAGYPFALPVYHEAAVGGGDFVLTLRGADGASPTDPVVDHFLNKLPANRYVRFNGNGGTIEVKAIADTDVDIYVYQKGGTPVNYSNQPCNRAPCEEIVSFSSNSGEYILNVQGYHHVDENYTATLSINSR